MFKNTFQSGFLSVLYSLGSKPLQIWDKQEKDGGGVRRVADPDIQSSVLEVEGGNVAANFVTCPADPAATLGIKLPLLVLLVKPLASRLFSFEVHVLDDKNVRRRFRASNFQFNLADFTKRAYGTNYAETLRVQVHANCRIRRIYFSDRLYAEDELPPEFKLYLPIQVLAPRPF